MCASLWKQLFHSYLKSEAKKIECKLNNRKMKSIYIELKRNGMEFLPYILILLGQPINMCLTFQCDNNILLPSISLYSQYISLFLSSRYSSPVDLKGLVLDLRGNPGGLLDAAVEIASYLVPSKSDIVSAKSRNGEEVIYRSVIDPIRPFGMKLAVMVSKNCIQINHRKCEI